MGRKSYHHYQPEVRRQQYPSRRRPGNYPKPALAIIFLGVFLGGLFLLGCSPAAGPAPPRELGAWLVYWEAESGLSELQAQGRWFHQVSLFAYELDEAGNPRPAPGVAEILPRFLQLARKQGFQPWVTVVNDVVYVNGTKKLKDVKIFNKLFRNLNTRLLHVGALVAMVQQHGFAGLTLDYEGLENFQADDYQALVAELAQELAKNNLGFNVVMEPKRGPLLRPHTARLTVMAYNLHGPHSGPGPRATPAFIAGLGKRGAGDSRGCPAIALAVGGFLWPPGGRAQKLSWNAAFRMAPGTVGVSRSMPADSPFARFPDKSEMWFEDPRSLQAKWAAAREAGFCDLWLWHLGGNDARLFQWLAQLGATKIGD